MRTRTVREIVEEGLKETMETIEGISRKINVSFRGT
jgi:hypothetical protein